MTSESAIVEAWREFLREQSSSYASCYCEENILRFSQNPVWHSLDHPVELYILFITNQEKRCPVWNQRAPSITNKTQSTSERCTNENSDISYQIESREQNEDEINRRNLVKGINTIVKEAAAASPLETRSTTRTVSENFIEQYRLSNNASCDARDLLLQACVWDYHVVLCSIHRVSIPDATTSTENFTNETNTNSDANDNKESSYSRQAVSFIWDLDSTLPFPTPFSEYLVHAFHPEINLGPYSQLFRVVTASRFTEAFASDRSHMYDAVNQTWSAPPPIWPPFSTTPVIPGLSVHESCTVSDSEQSKLVKMNLPIWWDVSNFQKLTFEEILRGLNLNFGVVLNLNDLFNLFTHLLYDLKE